MILDQLAHVGSPELRLLLRRLLRERHLRSHLLALQPILPHLVHHTKTRVARLPLLPGRGRELVVRGVSQPALLHAIVVGIYEAELYTALVILSIARDAKVGAFRDRWQLIQRLRFPHLQR